MATPAARLVRPDMWVQNQLSQRLDQLFLLTLSNRMTGKYSNRRVFNH